MRKTVAVLGSEGLIGKVICHRLCALYNVVRIDLDTGYDLSLFEDMKSACECRPYAMVNAVYPKDWEVHLKIYYHATMEFAGHMHDGGVIINIASIYGVLGSDDRIYDNTNIHATPIFYSMIKGGIIALSRAAATRYAKHYIRINSISPGGIITEDMQQEFVDQYNDRVPLMRMCCEGDVASMVEFLISDKADYITGQNFMVDGGLSAW